MTCKLQQQDHEYGDQQKGDHDPQPAIPSDLKVVKLKGELMKLLIAEAVQPRLYFVLGETEFPEPFTDHLHLDHLPDLFHVGGPVGLRHDPHPD